MSINVNIDFLVKQENTMNTKVLRGGIQVTDVEIEEIKAATKNPRRHTSTQIKRTQIKRLIESINTFGFVVPILVDRNGEIIAGQLTRRSARGLCKESGLARLEGPTPGIR